MSDIDRFLKEPDLSGMKGTERLKLVCENFKLLTFEQAYRLLDPDAFQDEFEDMQSYKSWIKGLNIARVILSLLPLVVTWLALFLAATSYQQDLATHSQDKTIAFLQLWQDGFHQTTMLTFSATAIIDVVLLMGFLAATVSVLLLEYRARRQSKQFAARLRVVTTGLLQAVNMQGVTPVASDADINRVVKAVRAALEGTFGDLGILINETRALILKADASVEQLFLTRVEPMFTRFEQHVSIFQQDVAKLTQEVNQMAASSKPIVQASDSMAESSTKMATSSADLTQHVSSINGHLNSLNTIQKNMAQEMRHIAGNMERATSDMRDVASKLAVVNPQDVQRISIHTNEFVDRAKDASIQLQRVITMLQQGRGTNSSSPRYRRTVLDIFLGR